MVIGSVGFWWVFFFVDDWKVCSVLNDAVLKLGTEAFNEA